MTGSVSEVLTPELMSTVHFLALWLAGVGIYFTAILFAGPCMCRRCLVYRDILDQRPDWGSDTQ